MKSRSDRCTKGEENQAHAAYTHTHTHTEQVGVHEVDASVELSQVVLAPREKEDRIRRECERACARNTGEGPDEARERETWIGVPVRMILRRVSIRLRALKTPMFVFYAARSRKGPDCGW